MHGTTLRWVKVQQRIHRLELEMHVVRDIGLLLPGFVHAPEIDAGPCREMIGDLLSELDSHTQRADPSGDSGVDPAALGLGLAQKGSWSCGARDRECHGHEPYR